MLSQLPRSLVPYMFVSFLYLVPSSEHLHCRTARTKKSLARDQSRSRSKRWKKSVWPSPQLSTYPLQKQVHILFRLSVVQGVNWFQWYRGSRLENIVSRKFVVSLMDHGSWLAQSSVSVGSEAFRLMDPWDQWRVSSGGLALLAASKLKPGLIFVHMWRGSQILPRNKS